MPPSHNPPLGFRARQMANPVLSDTPVQLQFLYRSLITIMSQSPAFRCPLTCAVPSQQQNSSSLSSPTAKTYWPNLFRHLDPYRGLWPHRPVYHFQKLQKLKGVPVCLMSDTVEDMTEYLNWRFSFLFRNFHLPTGMSHIELLICDMLLKILII